MSQSQLRVIIEQLNSKFAGFRQESEANSEFTRLRVGVRVLKGDLAPGWQLDIQPNTISVTEFSPHLDSPDVTITVSDSSKALDIFESRLAISKALADGTAKFSGNLSLLKAQTITISQLSQSLEHLK